MIETFMQLIRDSVAGNLQSVSLLLELFAKQQFSVTDQEQIHIYLKHIAEQNPYAIYVRALLFDHGYGVKQNADMAFLLMREAAAKGNAIAIYEVGHRFLEGIGVDTNYENAQQWLRIAAGSPNYIEAAMYDLGRMYEHGWGVAINETEANFWYDQAAKKGYIAASDKLKS